MLQKQEALVQAAKQAAANSYSPYSHFPVGAAILTKTGEIFAGTNVESVSFGATVCAERSALCAAIAAGHRKFLAIAVYSPKGCTPCGICRQMLAEFGDMWVIISSDSGEKSLLLSKLLPAAFSKLGE